MSSGTAGGGTEDVVEQNFPLAVGLAVLGAAAYAGGLVTQRYSLSAPESRPGQVLIFGVSVRRNIGWATGMVVYTSANCIYTVAMQYAPITLLTTVFAVALAMNAALSRAVLGETVDRNGVIGYGIIVAGIGISAVGLPKENAAYTAAEIGALALHASSIVYMVIMTGIIGVFSVWIARFEAKYPLQPPAAAPKPRSLQGLSDGAAETSAHALPAIGGGGGGGGGGSDGAGGGVRSSKVAAVPRGNELFAARLMYPMCLAAYETLGQLSLKAGSSMALVSAVGKQGNQTDKPLFWVVSAAGCIFFGQMIRWLRFAYRRFEAVRDELLVLELLLTTCIVAFGWLLSGGRHPDT
eukprot:SAG22_NODE_2841_length_2163_cov_1.521802_1_plen_352_part_00